MARHMTLKLWTIPEETHGEDNQTSRSDPSWRDSVGRVPAQPLGISINRLARDLDVPPNRIHGIVHGTRAVTADTALRLGIYFGTAPEVWMTLQSEYDLRVARRTSGEKIARRVRKREAA
jgi:addiction module HigA family antidote